MSKAALQLLRYDVNKIEFFQYIPTHKYLYLIQ